MTRSSPRTDTLRRSRPVAVATCLVVAVWLAAVGIVLAHADLLSSVPAANSSVTTSPPSLVLTFTEAIDPANSTISLLGPEGREPTLLRDLVDAAPFVRDNAFAGSSG